MGFSRCLLSSVALSSAPVGPTNRPFFPSSYSTAAGNGFSLDQNTESSMTLIQKIRATVHEGHLKEPFSPKDVKALGICADTTPGAFLSKRRVGNPGGNTQFFVRISSSSALCRLNS